MEDDLTARTFFAVIHRYLGLAALLFLFIAGATGCVLIFRDRLDAALNPDLFRVATSNTTLPPAVIADRIQGAHPEIHIVGFPLRLENGSSLVLDVTPANPGRPLGYDQLFVDPRDGRILGHRRKIGGWNRRHLVEGIYALHVRLLLGEPGRWLMGFVAVGWIISSLTGVFLTIPQKKPFWPKWKNFWLPTLRSPLPRLTLDLHRSSGLWMLAGYVVLAITAIELTFYYELMVPTVDALFRPPSMESMATQPQPTFQSAEAQASDFAGILAKAQAAAAKDAPGWVPAVANYDSAAHTYGIGFIPNGRETYSLIGPVTYVYRKFDHRLLYRDDPYASGPRGYILRSMFPLHTGEVAGWPSEILVFLLGLSLCGATTSGLYLWWRKTLSRRTRG